MRQKRKPDGAASVKVEYSAGVLTVKHGDTGDVLIKRRSSGDEWSNRIFPVLKNAGERGEFSQQISDAKCASPAPDDPEAAAGCNNDDRSGWAERALRAFNEATGSDLQDAVADLIADMAHFCDRHGMSIGREIARARGMYDDETDGQGNQFAEE